MLTRTVHSTLSETSVDLHTSSAPTEKASELSEEKRLSYTAASSSVFFWGSVVGLFSLCHITRSVISRFVTRPDIGVWYYLPSLKGILFLSSFGILIAPIVTDIRRIFASARKDTIRMTLAVCVGVAILLALLVLPPLGSQSMGERYGWRTLSPFNQVTDSYNKQLLMPAIAHILFFREGWLYYVFSNFVFLLFLSVLYSWLKTHTDIRPWHFLSLSTCSFVIFQYQFPGYPDVLMFTLFVLVMSSEFTQRSKLCLLLLALVTHFLSLFVGSILAFRYLNRTCRVSYFVALILYGVIWSAAYGFSVQAIFGTHNVYGMSGPEWVFRAPVLECLGVFIAFKAVWLLLILAMVLALRRRLYNDAMFIASCVSAGLLITFLGVDTSRHMAVAFPGVLVALQTIREHMPRDAANRILSMVFAANMVIPSFYVGLNMGIVLRPGLYKTLYLMFA
jgi:hypothetical protein